VATLAQILAARWADCSYQLTRGDDDYSGLSWPGDNPREKPEEADVRSLSTSVDAALAAAAAARANAETLLNQYGLSSLVTMGGAILALAAALPDSAFVDSTRPDLSALQALHDQFVNLTIG
jgi:hypothetical protein